ncbi:response regulator [Roseicella sp. DB1501]|uniref:response regulator n=1 Tax=Roseicella sp. DB1501 TaxID=2730925 RepID=UPI00149272D1|nr:response regulator [Roseicella sp. DB1501]NOG72646.1 response regulator [Roseicella sp. DB1501]
MIVEDDPMVAIDIESILLGAAEADVSVASSVRDACRVINERGFDAAFLDIDVLDGKTYELARCLAERGTPFAFVSGARREEVPAALREAPFLPKPYDPAEIERTYLNRLAPQARPSGKCQQGCQQG